MTSNSVVMFIDRAEVCASKVGIDSENDFIRHRRHRVALRSIDEMCNLEADLTLKEFFWKEFQLVLDTLINMLQSIEYEACMHCFSESCVQKQLDNQQIERSPGHVYVKGYPTCCVCSSG